MQNNGDLAFPHDAPGPPRDLDTLSVILPERTMFFPARETPPVSVAVHQVPLVPTRCAASETACTSGLHGPTNARDAARLPPSATWACHTTAAVIVSAGRLVPAHHPTCLNDAFSAAPASAVHDLCAVAEDRRARHRRLEAVTPGKRPSAEVWTARRVARQCAGRLSSASSVVLRPSGGRPSPQARHHRCRQRPWRFTARRPSAYPAQGSPLRVAPGTTRAVPVPCMTVAMMFASCACHD
jgi:hypothetical protein